MKKSLLSILAVLSFTSTVQAADYTLALQKGETFCFVSATEMSNVDESVIGRYFSEVFPLATKYGMQDRGAFDIVKTINSDYPAKFQSFFTFPSPQHKRDFSKEATWPELRELRTIAWDNLRILDYDVMEDVTIEMDSDKVYVMVWVWTKPDRFDDFVKIKDSLLALEVENGSRIVAQFDADKNNPAYYTLGVEQAPDFVMLTEWDTIEQYDKSRNSAAVAHTLKGSNTIIAGYESSILTLPKKDKKQS
jgi:hypothetical protein